MLCGVVSCDIALCRVMSSAVILCCNALCWAMLCYAVLRCMVLCYVVSCCAVLWSVIFCCVVVCHAAVVLCYDVFIELNCVSFCSSTWYLCIVLLACSAGRYGQSCRQSCECGGAACDPMTGRCICPAGKTGDSCQEGTAIMSN